MELDFPRTTSLISIVFSLIALFFTFRKDAHRVSLEVTPLWEQWIDVLGVNNDSSFAVGVLSVGYFDSHGIVTWLPSIGSFAENAGIDFPVRVEARSLYALQVLVVRHMQNPQAPHGYCVQLESGRIYVIRHTASLLAGLKLHIASVISRVTAGAFVPWVSRTRLPSRV